MWFLSFFGCAIFTLAAAASALQLLFQGNAPGAGASFVLAAAGALFARFCLRRFRAPSAAMRFDPRSANAAALLPGGYQEVVGERAFQQALERIAGPRGEESVAILVDALLVREPNNPNDPNAIAVTIGGSRVGYIPREDIGRFAGLIAVGRALSCQARITGGWERDGELGNYGVELDIASPPTLAGAPTATEAAQANRAE